MLDLITPFLVNSAVQAITPILLAALAGTLCGRVGVFNMALEGQMLVGAFAAVVGSYATGSALGGILFAMLATMLFSTILAYGVTIFRGDAVVICVGMNLLASGLTAYLLRQMFGVSGTFSDPAIVGLDKIRIAAINAWPVIGWIFSRQTAITWAAWILTALVTIMMFRTPLGLRLRGVGEDAEAATSMGVDVTRYRIVTVLVAGAIVGLAGAQLSIVYTPQWVENMTAGRGWIALALVVFASWRPWRVFAGAYLFGLLTIAELNIQAVDLSTLHQLPGAVYDLLALIKAIPSQFLSSIPYLATVVVLVVISRNRRLTMMNTPASLGRAFVPDR